MLVPHTEELCTSLWFYIVKNSPGVVISVDKSGERKSVEADGRSLDTSDVFCRQSAIEGAGLGLFAGRRFVRGEVVCKYAGNVLRTVEAIRLKDKSYLMRLGPQVYVDAGPRLEVAARYINDCRNPLLFNVAFDKRPDQQCALVVATRDLDEGEEIFANYGKFYWVPGSSPTRLEP